jgi:hypothetical protein
VQWFGWRADGREATEPPGIAVRIGPDVRGHLDGAGMDGTPVHTPSASAATAWLEAIAHPNAEERARCILRMVLYPRHQCTDTAPL